MYVGQVYSSMSSKSSGGNDAGLVRVRYRSKPKDSFVVAGVKSGTYSGPNTTE